MISFEEKIKNKQHILNNLDKYCFDGKGNIYHIEKMENLDFSNGYYFYPDGVADYEEVIDKIVHKILSDRSKWNFSSTTCEKEFLILVEILKEKEDWELFFTEEELRNQNNSFSIIYLPSYLRNKKSNLKIYIKDLAWNNDCVYFLVGELGFRKSIWKYYPEDRERKFKILKKRFGNNIFWTSQLQNSSPNNTNTHSSQLPQTTNRNSSLTITSARKNNSQINNSNSNSNSNNQIPTTLSNQWTKSDPTLEKLGANSQQQNLPISNEKEPTNKIPIPLILISGAIILLLAIIVFKKRINKLFNKKNKC